MGFKKAEKHRALGQEKNEHSDMIASSRLRALNWSRTAFEKQAFETYGLSESITSR